MDQKAENELKSFLHQKKLSKVKNAQKNSLIKSFNKQLELKSTIGQKIKNTRGGEQLSWIKKYNGLFIHEWGFKEKKNK